MTEIVLAVLGLAMLFTGFGVLTRGREAGWGCGLCSGECVNEWECDVYRLGEEKKAAGAGPGDSCRTLNDV